MLRCEMVCILVTNCYDVRKRGEYPTRCHGSVRMCPVGAGGFSYEVNAGKVLKRNMLEPLPSVMRFTSFIIDCMRVSLVVMKGTKKFGKPKCVR